MVNEKITALRVELLECEEKPSYILSRHKPVGCTNYAWIPQTMGDQIWVLFEFVSESERIAWEATLPGQIAGWLDRGLIKYALEYGWNVRDMNGFAELPK